jgi:hypothetical protein
MPLTHLCTVLTVGAASAALCISALECADLAAKRAAGPGPRPSAHGVCLPFCLCLTSALCVRCVLVWVVLSARAPRGSLPASARRVLSASSRLSRAQPTCDHTKQPCQREEATTGRKDGEGGVGCMRVHLVLTPVCSAWAVVPWGVAAFFFVRCGWPRGKGREGKGREGAGTLCSTRKQR